MNTFCSIFLSLLQSTFKTEANLYMLLPYEPNLSVDLKIEWGRGLRHGGLPLARFYTACGLLAIEHMHHKGVVHRDMKVMGKRKRKMTKSHAHSYCMQVLVSS